jgi:transposase-like protein
MLNEPKTLLEAVDFFKNPDNCRTYMVPRRWVNGVVTCPRCGTDRVKFSPKHNRWQCSKHHALRQFTLKTNTIMEDSPIGLDKWLPAIWLLASNRNGISSWELHRALGVTQKTAWFMLQRIRLAMQDDLTGGKLADEIEVDESFIGGKARNMHKADKRRKGLKGGGPAGKAIVLGILQREGNGTPKKIRATVIPDRTKRVMQENVEPHVEAGSQIYSDEAGSFWKMDQYEHEIVNHLEAYVNGNAHTNSLENFWSLLKRSVGGTYVSVEPFHLFRYVDEQAFRFNNRLPMSDADRFSFLLRKVVGKRLTYAQLIGQEDERPEAS